MSTRPSVSLAAAAAGVPPRYVYWHGHSGRRYLFTAADGTGAVDFDDGVAIAVRAGVILWAGDVGEVAGIPELAGPLGACVYVHLLAATAEERSSVIADLRPEHRPQVRLAA